MLSCVSICKKPCVYWLGVGNKKQIQKQVLGAGARQRVVSICFFVVVVLRSGNTKLTKNNKNAAFHSHRSVAFLSVVFFLLAVAIATPLSGRYASVIGRAAHATLRSWASKLSGSAWGRGWNSGRTWSCMFCVMSLPPVPSFCIRESLRIRWKLLTGLAQTSQLSI